LEGERPISRVEDGASEPKSIFFPLLSSQPWPWDPAILREIFPQYLCADGISLDTVGSQRKLPGFKDRGCSGSNQHDDSRQNVGIPCLHGGHDVVGESVSESVSEQQNPKRQAPEMPDDRTNRVKLGVTPSAAVAQRGEGGAFD
jgi:hypothetical protein